MAINNVTLVGNLVADPAKAMAGDTPLIEFSIAVNEYRNGENIPSFFDCVLYGKRAKVLCDMLKKGMKVTITGKLVQKRWQKDDQTHSKVYINTFDIEFAAPKAEGNDAADKENVPW